MSSPEEHLSEHHAYYLKRFVGNKYLPISRKLKCQPYCKYFKPEVLKTLSNFLRFEQNVNERKEFHLLFKKIYQFSQNHLMNIEKTGREKQCNYLIDLNYALIKTHSRYLLLDEYLFLVFSYFFKTNTSGNKTHQNLKNQRFYKIYEKFLLNFNTFYQRRPSTYTGTFRIHPNNYQKAKDHHLKNSFGKIFPMPEKKYEHVNKGKLINIETQYKQDFCNIEKMSFSREKDEEIKKKERLMKKSLKKDLLSKNRRPFHFDKKLNYSKIQTTSKEHLERAMLKKRQIQNKGNRGTGLTFGDEQLNKKMLQDPHSASFGIIIPQKTEFTFAKAEKKKKNIKHLKSSKLLSVGKLFANSTYKNHYFPMKNLNMNKVDRNELNQRNFGRKNKPYACVVNDKSSMFMLEKNQMYSVVNKKTLSLNARQEWKEVLNGKTALV